MSYEVTAFQARTRLGELLDRVRYAHEPCIIKRHGRPVAVLVDYASYQQQQAADWRSQLSDQYE